MVISQLDMYEENFQDLYFISFMREDQLVDNITPRLSPFPEGGLEIQVLVHFVLNNNAILNKIKTFIIKKKYFKCLKNSSLIR